MEKCARGCEREIVDVPLLFLHGLAELPTDKLPPPEALPGLDSGIAYGLRGDASISAVIRASFFVARLLTTARPGATTLIPPPFDRCSRRPTAIGSRLAVKSQGSPTYTSSGFGIS